MANPPEHAWIIERLGRQHERAEFDCGNVMLNDWLKLRAGQFAKKDLARTYVAVRPGETSVLGYHALSNHRVTFDALPEALAKGLPTIDVPVVLLGRLAVDRRMHGHGLGAGLLLDALARVQALADKVGIRAVEVDAIDDAARAFYLKLGFVPLLDDPFHLFLPMQVIRKLSLPPVQ